MLTKSRFAAGLFLITITLASLRGDEPVLRASLDDNGVLVSEGDRPVLFYQRAVKSLDGKWPRSNYVHPLYDLNGEVMTEDFPEDHGHHRGIFWAWHQVWVADQKIGDPWICKDFVWDVQSIECQSPVSSELSVISDVHWKSPQLVDDAKRMIPIAHERVEMTVYPAHSSYRVIDFEISLRALLAGVKIGGSEDVKGYGGFSPRIKLNDDQRFVSNAGEVEPTKTAMEAGPWINITGPRNGMVIISHPSNPRPLKAESDQWILRRGKSMQNAVYPGRDAVELSSKKPLLLRYRLIVHDGSLTNDAISSLR